jgi:hypothetical protein
MNFKLEVPIDLQHNWSSLPIKPDMLHKQEDLQLCNASTPRRIQPGRRVVPVQVVVWEIYITSIYRR